ncbi:MAG: PilZ protein [Magnetococcales bacterium]|nr:PilZ protein [Magnetococcales bacterium]HIJ85336.1 PilZ domain-containing protein [Magnetococcales bacterium]
MFGSLFRRKRKRRNQDDRKLGRYPIHVRISLVLENGAVVHGSMKSMSTKGLFLFTRDRPFGLAVGEEGDVGLEVDNPTDGAQMRFPCEVVRIDRNGIALRFLVQTDGQEGNFYPEDFMAE